MKKITLVASLLAAVTLAGCSNSDLYSGSVYSGGQAKEARAVSYGRIVSVRPVTIQGESNSQGVIGTVGGGALGGIVGSTVGGGKGQAIATAVGAIAGAVVGNKIEQKVDQTSGVELVIQKEDGQRIAVVQKADPSFVPGARVQIVGSGGSLNVSVL
ncbi:glycine zipper 2TM domain-containing protein [Gallibacterium anatis]|uniref:Membrane protein n=2 Tax=Gallibacterium anatis TaxID=750 RepID=A0A0A3AAG7_9PAST|nr:glycine zipper 2TM domain-containing protein [Gallibacterium anatis]ERF79624.1 membrane protein [Gallibacterium anatis 12656/12]KGQ29107.1 membrane protein [Gallibacterium anatis]KGQ44259.1 membrane protein [Gallibacterium anatis]KGQ46556.1 membrane protein [Gallibacterium anatis]KGQ48012.1 membrane protein [Gallibacterium anatis]